MACRLYEGNYPAYKIKKNMRMKDGVAIAFPDKFIEVLERAWVFAKREDYLEEIIEITIADKHITVKSDSPRGKFEESMRFDSDMDFTFPIVPYLIMDILKEVKSAIVGNNKLKFESLKDSEWVYVTSLYKPEK